jgi:hypothetical protein
VCWGKPDISKINESFSRYLITSGQGGAIGKNTIVSIARKKADFTRMTRYQFK